MLLLGIVTHTHLLVLQGAVSVEPDHGSIKALSAPNLWLAEYHCNTSTLLNIEIANCFLYF